MKTSSWILALGCLILGTLLAGGWLPGAEDQATGPRIGIAMTLLTIGLLIVTMGLMPLILRKTTRPEDYEGNCPVGTSCTECGAFNLKPRTTCRSCSAEVQHKAS